MKATHTSKPRNMSIKMWRTLCPHTNVIELGDGTKVCTSCEAVIK